MSPLFERTTKVLTLSLTAVVFSVAFAEWLVADEPSRNSSSASSQLLADLGATEFSARSAASARLKRMTAEEILSLARQAHDRPNAEVVSRIQAEIENRYATGTPSDLQAVSAVLEAQIKDSRLLVADAAQQSLRQHWKKRIEIAIAELEKHGAVIRRGAFTKAKGQRRMMLPFPQSRSQNATQILITESWTGGDEEIAVFERLSMLSGPMATGNGVSVFLIGGNPLTPEQEQKIASTVGQNRVVKRSRVALGIVANRRIAQGVLIDDVSPGSSAADANLQPGDLIVAIDEKSSHLRNALPPEPPQKDGDGPLRIEPGSPINEKTRLRDFDDLVDRLMDYSEGETMTIHVRRGFASGHFYRTTPDGEEPAVPQLEVIKVKMKGWEALIPE